jgi:hypothetical protein
MIYILAAPALLAIAICLVGFTRGIWTGYTNQ